MSAGEPKTTATAVVQVTLEVVLDRPWSDVETIAAIQKTATREAIERVQQLAASTGGLVRVGSVASVRIVLNEVRP